MKLNHKAAEVTARRTSLGWVGSYAVFEFGNRIFSTSTRVAHVHRKDAIEFAKREAVAFFTHPDNPLVFDGNTGYTP